MKSTNRNEKKMNGYISHKRALRIEFRAIDRKQSVKFKVQRQQDIDTLH